jgi:hypothetical protein
LDHVIPKDRGGELSWQNIVTSCLTCNSKKANRTPREAGMKLLRKPRAPKSRPFVSYIIGQELEKEWESFLMTSHNETEVEIIGARKEFAAREVAVAE